MKRLLLLTTCLVVLSLFSPQGVYAQNKALKTKNHTVSFIINPETGIGSRATENYTYYLNKYDEQVRDGKYTLTSNHNETRSSYAATVTEVASYNCTATFKDGWLNGPVSITMSSKVTGREYGNSNSTLNTVIKATLNYKDGLPHGAWRYTQHENGQLEYYSYINFKDGQLVGNFESKIYVPSSFEPRSSKGSLTADGKLASYGRDKFISKGGEIYRIPALSRDITEEMIKILEDIASEKLTTEEAKDNGWIAGFSKQELSLADQLAPFSKNVLCRNELGGDKSHYNSLPNDQVKEFYKPIVNKVEYQSGGIAKHHLATDELIDLALEALELNQGKDSSEIVHSNSKYKVSFIYFRKRRGVEEYNEFNFIAEDLSTQKGEKYYIHPSKQELIKERLREREQIEIRQEFVRDSIATRERFVRDSIATQERNRIERERFVRDSISSLNANVRSFHRHFCSEHRPISYGANGVDVYSSQEIITSYRRIYDKYVDDSEKIAYVAKLQQVVPIYIKGKNRKFIEAYIKSNYNIQKLSEQHIAEVTDFLLSDYARFLFEIVKPEAHNEILGARLPSIASPLERIYLAYIGKPEKAKLMSQAVANVTEFVQYDTKELEAYIKRNYKSRKLSVAQADELSIFLSSEYAQYLVSGQAKLPQLTASAIESIYKAYAADAEKTKIFSASLTSITKLSEVNNAPVEAYIKRNYDIKALSAQQLDELAIFFQSGYASYLTNAGTLKLQTLTDIMLEQMYTSYAMDSNKHENFNVSLAASQKLAETNAAQIEAYIKPNYDIKNLSAEQIDQLSAFMQSEYAMFLANSPAKLPALATTLEAIYKATCSNSEKAEKLSKTIAKVTELTKYKTNKVEAHIKKNFKMDKSKKYSDEQIDQLMEFLINDAESMVTK